MLREDLVKIVVVGSVDHGKSTFIGRLLMECNQIPTDKIEQIEKVCSSRNMDFEPAFLLDALEEEQRQGISIDSTQVYLQYRDQRILLIDAPGHVDFWQNMITATSHANQAIVIIDALQGIQAQTIRQIKVLSVMGISSILTVINKIDQIDYSEKHYLELSNEIVKIIEREGLTSLAVIPISALYGDNLVSASSKMPWYKGDLVLPFLFLLKTKENGSSSAQSFRMPLQDVYRFSQERYFVGQITSGQIKVGAKVLFSPSGKQSSVKNIEKFPHKIEIAHRGESVAVTLTDQIFVERGEVMTFPDQVPIIDTEIMAKMLRLSTLPLDPNLQYSLKIGTSQTPCTISLLNSTDDGMVEVLIHCTKPVVYDLSADKNGLFASRFVICSEHETIACGTVLQPNESFSSQAANVVLANEALVKRNERESQQKHRGTVLWITGLSGAGKSSLASIIERNLFSKRHSVVALDADNVRKNLCADLAFSRADRSENVRRLASSARLFLDAGFIVVVACISPYAEDRALAKSVIGAEDFHEIFLFCPLEICEQRDPKGLYKKTRAGNMASLPGCDAPYQIPAQPNLRLDSSTMNLEQELNAVLAYLSKLEMLSVNEFVNSCWITPRVDISPANKV